MNKFILFFLFSFSFSNSPLVSVGGRVLFDYDFFQAVSFSEWSSFDSLKQKSFFDNFLEKELVYQESLDLGLHYHHENFIKLQTRKKQLLINSFYEKVVASPFVENKYIKETKKFLGDKVFVYHLLFSYKGASLPGSFNRSKEDAFVLANKTKEAFADSSLFLSLEDKLSLFKGFSSSFSEDPSAKTNGGEIGWISWGMVMPSFQSVAFSSPVFVVSEPVLTDYGYHLVFVEKRGFSDYHYYNKDFLDGFSSKFGLQTVSVDTLREAALSFDSLFMKEGFFRLNDVFVDSLYSTLYKKMFVEKKRGNKNLYIDWLRDFHEEKDVLFVFNGRGFGLGWFLNVLKNTPSTRVPSLRQRDDFVSLLKSFVLRENVLKETVCEEISSSYYFVGDYLNHKKNILTQYYEGWVLSSLFPVDSLKIKKLYDGGVFRGDYIRPRQAVFTEIRVGEKSLMDSIFVLYNNGVSYDSLVLSFGGALKKPISFGGKGVLGEVVFGLKEGEVSSPFENLNKTFSFLRLERFLEEQPFSLSHVYNQIEKKVKKTIEDSLKHSFLPELQKKHSVRMFEEVLF